MDATSVTPESKSGWKGKQAPVKPKTHQTQSSNSASASSPYPRKQDLPALYKETLGLKNQSCPISPSCHL